MKSQTSVKLNKLPMRIITLISFILLFSILGYTQTPENINLLNEGSKLPDFSLELVNGETISTSSLYGKTVVMVFFATWCPPCIKELPHVEKEIWQKYKDNENFELFVIGREHSKEEIIEFAKERNLTFPIVADTDRSIFKIFAKQNIPRMYLINKESSIISLTSGYNQTSFDEFIIKLEQELKK